MADSIKSSRSGATYLLQRAKSAAPLFRYKSAAPPPEPQIERQPTVVLYVDQHCPTHGSQNNCTCTSVTTDKNGLVNTDSFHQHTYDNHGSNNDLVSSSMEPFNNNPSLPYTQRDIVGNNLHYNSPSQTNGWRDVGNNELGSLLIYRDALKRNLTTPSRAGGGFPKIHYGRSGGQWSHIKQTNTYSGSNFLFIDGTVRIDDAHKYPTRRFGYPPVNRPQQTFASPSNQDFTHISSNPATQSSDYNTWSATDQLNRRPSLSQYANRYERHAKDGFAYWPTDLVYRKPRGKTTSTGTYKTWLGLSDASLKL